MAIDRNKVIANAQKHIQKGAFKKAVAEYQRIIAEDPGDVRILLKIGDLQARDGSMREAIRTYGEVADHYVADGFFLKAVAIYKQVLKLDENYIDAKVRLAELYYQLSLLSDAMAQLQLVAADYLKLGQTVLYLETLQRMVDIDPDNVSNRIKLAEQLAKNGDVTGAVQHFRSAADFLLMAGKFDDYTKVAERYLHYRPDDEAVLRRLAKVYLDLGKHKQSFHRVHQLFRSEKVDRETVRLLADSLVGSGEPDRAANILHEVAQQWEDAGREADAAEVWRLIVSFKPNDELARKKVGVDEVELEPEFEFDVDSADANRSPEQRNAEIAKILQETDVYLKYSLYDRALEHLARGLAVDPRSAEILERRRKAYLDLERKDDAARDNLALASIVEADEPERARALRAEAARLAPGIVPVDAVVAARAAAPRIPTSALEPIAFVPIPAGFGAPRAVQAAAPVEEAEPIVADSLPEAVEASGVGGESAGFDDFDALFGADSDPEDAGAEALSEAFIADVAPTPVPEAESITIPDEISPELLAAIARAENEARAGDVAAAQSMLLELVGEWPEHAEVLLAHMDALPVGSGDSGMSLIVQSGIATPQPDSEAVASDPEPSSSDDDEADDLFLMDDDAGSDDASVASPAEASQPGPSTDDEKSSTSPGTAIHSEREADDDILLGVPLDEDDDAAEPAELVGASLAGSVADVTHMGFNPGARQHTPGGSVIESAPAVRAEAAESVAIEFGSPDTTSAGFHVDPPPIAALIEDEAESETAMGLRAEDSSIAIVVDDEPVESATIEEDDAEEFVIDIDVPDELDHRSGHEVDAPMGRPFTGMAVIFSPSRVVLEEDGDSELAGAIRMRMDGGAIVALDTLQDEIFGDHPVSATFEHAVAGLDMGLYMEGAVTLERLLGLHSLLPLDRALIHYYIGIAHEAVADTERAREQFIAVEREAPAHFPDVRARLARL